MEDHNLTSTAAVLAYLATTTLPEPYKTISCNVTVTRLNGGSANFVYLINQTRTDAISIVPTTNTPPLILKHSQPYVATAPGIPFSLDRQTSEARALTILPQHLTDIATKTNVHTPNLLLHDQSHNVLIFPSAGSRNLKAAYSDPTSPIHAIGTRLGHWLAALHSAILPLGIRSEVVPRAGTDDKAARDMYRYCYRNVGATLAAYGVADGLQLGERVNAVYGERLMRDDEQLCHGDFWPGNVIVADAEVNSCQTQEYYTPGLTVVDWEMTRRGCGATDVGQFLAEAWLLDRFRGGRKLVAAFLQGYFSAMTLQGLGADEYGGTTLVQLVCDTADALFLERMGVHLGTHLAFWPTRVEWADGAGTREVVRVGRRIMAAAMDGMHAVWLRDLLERGEGDQ